MVGQPGTGQTFQTPVAEGPNQGSPQNGPKETGRVSAASGRGVGVGCPVSVKIENLPAAGLQQIFLASIDRLTKQLLMVK